MTDGDLLAAVRLLDRTVQTYSPRCRHFVHSEEAERGWWRWVLQGPAGTASVDLDLIADDRVDTLIADEWANILSDWSGKRGPTALEQAVAWVSAALRGDLATGHAPLRLPVVGWQLPGSRRALYSTAGDLWITESFLIQREDLVLDHRFAAYPT